MEIEAKFKIPDARAARELQRIARVGEFTLGPAQTIRVRDTFYDTAARHLSASRHVLRVRRRKDGKTILTFKAPTHQDGVIHRRPETEMQMAWPRAPRKLSRENLPPRIFKLVAPLCANAPLHSLFTTQQTRHVRVVRRGRRVIGEWSLDRVEFRAGARRKIFYELEIELKKSGTEVELQKLLDALAREWKLEPETRGKFQRARVFMRQK